MSVVYDNVKTEPEDEYEYSMTSNDIHPLGYSSLNNITLSPPPGTEDSFYIMRYVYDYSFDGKSSLPAPFECFTKEQAGNNGKHILYSFLQAERDQSENNTMHVCNEIMTMHRIKCYASRFSFDHMQTLNLIYGGGGNGFYGFLLLPESVKSAQDLLYPRRALVHQFENSHKQRMVAINYYRYNMQIEKFDQALVSDVDDRVFVGCSLVASTLTNVGDFIPTMEKEKMSKDLQKNEKEGAKELLKTSKSKTSGPIAKSSSPNNAASSSSLYQFFESYNYEIICCLATITRCKLNVNKDCVPNLFPNSKNINMRQEFNIDTTYLSQSLSSLRLNGNPLKTFPQCIFGLTELRRLCLNHCGIRILPDEFEKLPKLMELYVSCNFITALPKTLSKPNFLWYLAVDGVQYFSSTSTVTFEEFKKFGKKYHFPSFENKQLAEIESMMNDKYGIKSFATVPVEDPNEILKLNSFLTDECPRFECFANKDNLGLGFPEEICSFKNLQILSLTNQNFAVVPNEIGNLKKLKQLNLSGCQHLKEVSVQLASIGTFEQINLFGCTSLTNPPPDVVRRGMDSIIGYLKRSLAGTQLCRRTKLMMVGLGGAGKTKFVGALQSDNFCTSEDDIPDVTDGIDTTQWTKTVDKSTEISYVIWDFAGQSVYYNTHQFFLSKRAIYFLLWNSRLGYENAGLEFWLSSIACHAPEEPIFVIATHADQISHIEIPVSELQQSYPQIVHFAHISSITGFVIAIFKFLCLQYDYRNKQMFCLLSVQVDGMEDLVKKIVEVTLAQRYINNLVPTIYLNFEEQLRGYVSLVEEDRMESKVLSIEYVKEQAKRLGLVTPLEIKEALNFLHELGSVQYFSNDVLKEYIILKPQWLVEAMACLISVKANIIKDGRFDRKDINVIWSKYPADLHDWLLRLTEEFDLTFALPNENISIVPCMLPDVEPQVIYYN